jgi:hypothetical protein
MIDVLWSRASEKKEQFPLSCPQAGLPLRGSTIRRSCIVATLEGKSLVYCMLPLISCQPRLGKRPAGLGKPKLLLKLLLLLIVSHVTNLVFAVVDYY